MPSQKATDDALRVLRGVAAVVASGVAESQALRKLAGGEFVPIARAVADVLSGAPQRVAASAQPAAAAAPRAPPAVRMPDSRPTPRQPPPAVELPVQRQAVAAEARRAEPLQAASAAVSWERDHTAAAAARATQQPAHGASGQSFAAAGAAAAAPLPPHVRAAAGQHAAPSAPPPSGTAQAAGSVRLAPVEADSPEPDVLRDLPTTAGRRKRSVPSSPMARVFGFASLGATLAAGTVKDAVVRAWKGEDKQKDAALYSAVLTEQNAERLAVALCRMRGAALKLGQMLSIQDESVVPPQIQKALERVRQGADVMPTNQLYQVLDKELGKSWRTRVAKFEDEPMAAASIGQVHKATLLDGRLVAMKVQYPGVAESIHSDIDNLMRLARMTDLLPKGLYIDQAVKVAKQELSLECDYRWELAAQKRFSELLATDPAFRVPGVVEELCSEHILTTELAPGVPIDKAASLSQEERDHVGTQLLRLILRELFEFRFM